MRSLKTMSLIFCLVAIPLTASAAPIVSGSAVWSSGPGNNDHLYVLYTDTTPNGWLAANTFATTVAAPLLGYGNGNLASILSADEQAFVLNLNQTTGGPGAGGSIWLGGTDNSAFSTINEWIWTDGSGNFWDQGGSGNPQNGLYANWNGGEPNGGGDGESFLEMQNSGGWNDLGTQTLSRFVVEFEAVPEPASIAIWSMLGLGLAGFGYYRMRRSKK